MTEGRIKGFDGLRAIAVGLVLVMHKTTLGTQTQIGFYGVWLFFLLSGYLITSQLHAARLRIEAGSSARSEELFSFWYRRAFRIFPAYYAVLIGISLFYAASDRPNPGLLYYATHLSNIYFAWNLDQFQTTWAHFWSLAVEEQFYVLFAPLLLLTPARHAVPICLALIGASLVRRFTLASGGAEHFAIYIDSLVNFGLLAAGGLLFLTRERITSGLLRGGGGQAALGWCALIAYLALAATTNMMIGGDLPRLHMAYVAAIAVGLILLAHILANQASSLVSALEWGPMVFLGRISYGIYLLNDYVPADIPSRICKILAPRLLDSGPLTTFLLNAAGVAASMAITVMAAVVSWRLIEHPALMLRDRTLRRARRASLSSRRNPEDDAAVVLSARPSGAS